MGSLLKSVKGFLFVGGIYFALFFGTLSARLLFGRDNIVPSWALSTIIAVYLARVLQTSFFDKRAGSLLLSTYLAVSVFVCLSVWMIAFEKAGFGAAIAESFVFSLASFIGVFLVDWLVGKHIKRVAIRQAGKSR